MSRNRIATTMATVLSCATLGLGLVGCDVGKEVGEDFEAEFFEGTKTFTVGDEKVNVSCSGNPVEDGPVVMLLHGGGDDVTKLADFQKKIAEDHRVCSYDRLGAGKSDKPKGEQSYDDVGKTLTNVIDKFSDADPVVLVGHSMGGVIAGRYAPDNPDKVAGVVLLDATSPSAVADMENRIPEGDGPSGQLREETLAVYGGQNPEQLVFADGEVKSVGDVPVRVLRHGQQYLAELDPKYGEGLEQDWAEGQKAWLGLSSDSKLTVAKQSGHYIHDDEPELALKAIADVVG